MMKITKEEMNKEIEVLKKLGLTEEEIKGYFEFYGVEFGLYEKKKPNSKIIN